MRLHVCYHVFKEKQTNPMAGVTKLQYPTVVIYCMEFISITDIMVMMKEEEEEGSLSLSLHCPNPIARHS